MENNLGLNKAILSANKGKTLPSNEAYYVPTT